MVNIGIIYQTDPLGTIPGGIDTFIRGVIKYAPGDISVNVIGMTTNNTKRPVGQWSVYKIDNDNRPFSFLPVFYEANPGCQRKIPLSVELSFRLFFKRILSKIDVLEFHRIDAILPFLIDRRPKNLVIHQNMSSIRDESSDIRWRHFPRMYFTLERLLLGKINSLFSVREDAVNDYRKRYSKISSKFNFIPTWMDPDIFYPLSETEKIDVRKKMCEKFGLNHRSPILICVGRLDQQKDPLLMAKTFKRLLENKPEVQLIWIGDGVLAEKVKDYIAGNGLVGKMILAGLHKPKVVAYYLNACDLFVLSSAYEGMPMCVLEALGCGTPVVTTSVGEVGRVVMNDINGEIIKERTATELSDAILRSLKKINSYSGKQCTDAVLNYTPDKVLKPYYENHRKLAGMV